MKQINLKLNVGKVEKKDLMMILSPYGLPVGNVLDGIKSVMDGWPEGLLLNIVILLKKDKSFIIHNKGLSNQNLILYTFDFCKKKRLNSNKLLSILIKISKLCDNMSKDNSYLTQNEEKKPIGILVNNSKEKLAKHYVSVLKSFNGL